MEEIAKQILEVIEKINNRLDSMDKTMSNGFSEMHKRLDSIEAKLDKAIKE